jgi:hypothetical protein
LNVLMLTPGFPAEMPYFARGLGRVGARVFGIGEQPLETLERPAREGLVFYERVDSLWREDRVIDLARRIHREVGLDRVECLWEPGVILAARLREALDVPGMREPQATLFRDKSEMKRALERAGIRVPRHERARSDEQRRLAARRIGFPLIVKPIAGAGSADTHRVDDAAALERLLPSLRHVDELSVEEFVEGEEYTFDTICAGGRPLFENVAWYRPKPLLGRSIETLSPQTVTLRRPEELGLEAGIEVGRRVLAALDFREGFTHMEWFLTPQGEPVFGEIAARPPGARSVDLMNYACDFDAFTAWAEAVCHGRLSRPVVRRYNSVAIFKRAEGQGRIHRIVGLERLVARYDPHIVCIDLLPVGAPRRNWRQTLVSDGYLIVRHADLRTAMEIADRVGTDLRLEAAER